MRLPVIFMLIGKRLYLVTKKLTLLLLLQGDGVSNPGTGICKQ